MYTHVYVYVRHRWISAWLEVLFSLHLRVIAEHYDFKVWQTLNDFFWTRSVMGPLIKALNHTANQSWVSNHRTMQRSYACFFTVKSNNLKEATLKKLNEMWTCFCSSEYQDHGLDCKGTGYKQTSVIRWKTCLIQSLWHLFIGSC